MKTPVVIAVASLILTGASSAAEIGKVFQSHTPDGTPYLVVQCFQPDECLEKAYQYCKGPYKPLDEGTVHQTGFRFVCRTEKAAKEPATAQP